jgi:LysM repeat protein
LYSLSKKYNVSVDEIKQQNEVLLKNGLQIGQILTIKKNLKKRCACQTQILTQIKVT